MKDYTNSEIEDIIYEYIGDEPIEIGNIGNIIKICLGEFLSEDQVIDIEYLIQEHCNYSYYSSIDKEFLKPNKKISDYKRD